MVRPRRSGWGSVRWHFSTGERFPRRRLSGSVSQTKREVSDGCRGPGGAGFFAGGSESGAQLSTKMISRDTDSESRSGSGAEGAGHKAFLVAGFLAALSVILVSIEESRTAAAMRLVHQVLEFDLLEDFIEVAAQFGSTWGMILVPLTVYLLDDGRRRRAAQLFGGGILTGVSINLLKLLFYRQRPALDRHNLYAALLPPEESGRWFLWPETWEQFTDQSRLGFPSGDAAMAAFLARGLSMYYPKGWPVWWMFAVGTMLFRFVNARHYLSDICMGAALGILIFELVDRSQLIVRAGSKAAAWVRRWRLPGRIPNAAGEGARRRRERA